MAGITGSVDSDSVLVWVGKLNAKANTIAPEVAEATEALGGRVVKTARGIVKAEAFDTGALWRSIDFDVNVNRLGAELTAGPTQFSRTKVGNDRDATAYAGFVARGVRGRKGVFYMERAFARHTGPRGKYMRDVLRAGVTV